MFSFIFVKIWFAQYGIILFISKLILINKYSGLSVSPSFCHQILIKAGGLSVRDCKINIPNKSIKRYNSRVVKYKL